MTLTSYNLHNHCSTCTCPVTADCHPWRLCHTPLECPTRCTPWQDMEIMTMRMSLLPSTLLPWTLHHQIILCPNEKVNYLTNRVKNPTLAITLLSYKINSGNFRNDSLTWNLPSMHLHIWQSLHSIQIDFNTSLWHSNHIQPPSEKKNLSTQLCKHTQTPLVSHRERQVSPHPYSKISSHLVDKTPQS